MSVRKVPVWMCEDCGGPAVWTFIAGHIHYHCERQCDGFMQLELPGLTTELASVKLDRTGSVSALNENEDACVEDEEIVSSEQGCSDLPF